VVRADTSGHGELEVLGLRKDLSGGIAGLNIAGQMGPRFSGMGKRRTWKGVVMRTGKRPSASELR
jgi:hypothetical protein